MKRILRSVAGVVLVLLGGYFLLLAIAWSDIKEYLLLRVLFGGLGFGCGMPGLYLWGFFKPEE